MDDLADATVGEVESVARTRQDAHPDQLFEGRRELPGRARASGAEQREVKLSTDNGRRGQRLLGQRIEESEVPVNELPDARGHR